MSLQNLLGDPAMAGTWTLEPETSSIRFGARTLWGLVPVNGRFTEFTGEARITAEGRLTGRVIVRAESVHTRIGMRDRHLRGADFFDVAAHPDIVVDFTGTADELSATLTIRGTTLPVRLQTAAEREGESIRVSARGEVDRTRWGVSGNMLGMMPPGTALLAEAVFVHSGA